jgi:predicted methyltransferase
MALHRIDPAVVRRDFVAAGFEPDGESDVLRNPADDHSRSVFDAAVAGRTDRFVLRFRKRIVNAPS